MRDWKSILQLCPREEAKCSTGLHHQCVSDSVSLHTVTISLKMKLKSTTKADVLKDSTVWHGYIEMWQTSCHAYTPGSPLKSPICTCLAESSAFQCDVLGAFGGLPLWTWHTDSEPPPPEPTGRSEETCEGLRCEVGQWRAERNEDMRHVSGSSAAPKHPSRWAKDMFLLSFYWSSSTDFQK